MTITGTLAAVSVATVITPSQAMTGGHRIFQRGSTPWLATFAAKGKGSLLDRASCGGVLVGPTRVLTAAHCLDIENAAQKVEVHLGSVVLSRDRGVVRDVERVALNPGYRLLPSTTDPHNRADDSATHDLAVVTLSRPVRGIPPVAIAGRRPHAGSPVAFFAHGLTADPSKAGKSEDIRGDVLRRGALNTIGNRRCARENPARLDSTVLCAQDFHGTDVTMCEGDSGSPLLAREHGRPTLVGIASFGGETASLPCGKPTPLAFADTAKLRHWALLPHPPGRKTTSH